MELLLCPDLLHICTVLTLSLIWLWCPADLSKSTQLAWWNTVSVAVLFSWQVKLWYVLVVLNSDLSEWNCKEAARSVWVNFWVWEGEIEDNLFSFFPLVFKKSVCETICKSNKISTGSEQEWFCFWIVLEIIFWAYFVCFFTCFESKGYFGMSNMIQQYLF